MRFWVRAAVRLPELPHFDDPGRHAVDKSLRVPAKGENLGVRKPDRRVHREIRSEGFGTGADGAVELLWVHLESGQVRLGELVRDLSQVGGWEERGGWAGTTR